MSIPQPRSFLEISPSNHELKFDSTLVLRTRTMSVFSLQTDHQGKKRRIRISRRWNINPSAHCPTEHPSHVTDYTITPTEPADSQSPGVTVGSRSSPTPSIRDFMSLVIP